MQRLKTLCLFGWLGFAWLGMSACGVETNPPSDNNTSGLAPGGDVSAHIGAADSSFGTDVPAGVSGTCSTSQYWQRGDSESSKMHPGRACIECHTERGEGPRNGFLGSVQQAVDDADDCRGVSDVLVEIIDDSNDEVVASGTSNGGGNFDIASAFSGAYRVRLTLDGRTREMFGAQTDRDCMTCHTAAGDAGAPGRIVAP